MKNASIPGSTEFDGVVFSEHPLPGVTILRRISVEISRQNSNLDQVRKQMAAEAIRIGANAIMNFRYGQRAHQWWQLLFTLKWDTESWYGEGDAVRV